MESLGELIWFAAFLVQMIALLAGGGFVIVFGFVALVEIVRRKVCKSRVFTSPVSLRGHA